MALNILKFTLQKEKKRIFIFKYCKIDVKSAATIIFAATLITAPTVGLIKYFQHYNCSADSGLIAIAQSTNSLNFYNDNRCSPPAE
jgi:hypothetical protein